MISIGSKNKREYQLLNNLINKDFSQFNIKLEENLNEIKPDSNQILISTSGHITEKQINILIKNLKIGDRNVIGWIFIENELSPK